MKKYILGIFITSVAVRFLSADPAGNISHAKQDGVVEERILKIADKIRDRGDLPTISAEMQLDLLEELSTFGLGRFLIERGGLNGYWTDYLMKHPFKGKLTGLNNQNEPFCWLEDFMLNQAPAALAKQQCFSMFKKQLQKKIKNGISLASIPCRLMSELVDLDFSRVSDFSLTGVDLDPEAIILSQEAALQKGLSSHVELLEKDAWSLTICGAFDVIASNGLCIYEPNDGKVVELYKIFFTALKPGGVLMTSFVTPSVEWNKRKVNGADALLQKIILSDIVECRGQSFRSEELVRSQMRKAGFVDIEVIWDTAHIFPIILGKKVG